jgi:hypothetical protein
MTGKNKYIVEVKRTNLETYELEAYSRNEIYDKMPGLVSGVTPVKTETLREITVTVRLAPKPTVEEPKVGQSQGQDPLVAPQDEETAES